MADESSNTNNNEGTGLNRRNFLKSAGAVVAGSTLGAGLTLSSEAAAAAAAEAPSTITNFRCPICAKDFNTYGGLKTHFAQTHPGYVLPVTTKLKVNGKEYEVLIEPHWTLQRTLQFKLGLTGAKPACERGECGACTVLVDGVARYSCLTLAVEAEGHEITSIEGLAEGEQLSPLQQAFVEEDAYQCGYCTPGQIMAVEGLLRHNPAPSAEEIRVGVSGNLCRCGTYPHIFKAARRAAELKGRKGGAG